MDEKIDGQMARVNVNYKETKFTSQILNDRYSVERQQKNKCMKEGTKTLVLIYYK